MKTLVRLPKNLLFQCYSSLMEVWADWPPVVIKHHATQQETTERFAGHVQRQDSMCIVFCTGANVDSVSTKLDAGGPNPQSNSTVTHFFGVPKQLQLEPLPRVILYLSNLVNP